MITLRYKPVPASCRAKQGHLLRVIGAILSLFLLAAVSGCASNQYGRFNNSAEVASAFENGQSFPDYNYFYAGRQSMPHALIGIDKTYKVPSKLWKAFTPTSDQLTRMSGHILLVQNALPYGAQIMSPAGERIGVWYSRIVKVHVKVVEADKTVSIVFVDPENDGGGRDQT